MLRQSLRLKAHSSVEDEDKEEQELQCPPPLLERIEGGRGILARKKCSTAPQPIGRGLLLSKCAQTNHHRIEQVPGVIQEVTQSLRSRLRQNPPPTKHFITMSEAKEHVTENTKRIVVLPPAAGDLGIPSDEDDVPADNEDEIEVAGEVEIEELTSDDDDGDLEATNIPPARWKKTTEFQNPLENIQPLQPLEDKFPILATLSPYDLWKEVFDKDMRRLVQRETQRYASRDKGDFSFRISETDIEIFLGILLLSGYHTVPSERDYWANDPDLNVPIVATAMSRDRYLKIKKYLHVANNQKLEVGNKVAKVSRLYEMLNASLLQVGIFHHHLAADESMLPYFGKHSGKMFIRGKPIRFGFKLWVLAGDDGFPYNLEIYTGRQNGQQIKVPLGYSVITRLIQPVQQLSTMSLHTLHFDNFFTSYELLLHLKKIGLKASGTIRKNRTNACEKKLVDDKTMKKQGRGSYDFRCDGDVYIVKWNDNDIVRVASNYSTHEPLNLAQRRVGSGILSVQQPNVIKQYNANMGGVDLFDRLLGAYRPSIKGKKWWWPLFTNVLNISVVAAWRLYCTLNKNRALSHLDFLREITICLLKSSPNERPQVGGGAHVDLPDHVRFDQIGHDVVDAAQGRCVVCSTNTRTKCIKCNVRLHIARTKPCFTTYHTKQ
jgi:DNA excision repair protein ERCC-6